MLYWMKHRMVLGVAGNCNTTCAAYSAEDDCVIAFGTTTCEDDLTR
jgi:hypothetical protein